MTWPTKKIVDILDPVEKIPGVLAKNYLKSGKYPIVDQGQSMVGGYADNISNVYHGELPVIIFGDHTRAVKFIDFTFAVGADGTKILKPKSDIDSKYFYYFLQSIHIPARGYARHFSLLKELQISVPPIEEQRKIVKKIEELFTKIDEAQKLREEAQKDSAALLPAALQHIFSQGKEKGWEEAELEQVANSVADGTHDTPKYQSKGFPLITSKNLRSNGLSFDTAKFISESDYKEINKRSFVSKGDILLGMIGTIGNVTRIKTDREFSIKNVGLIRPNNKKVLAEYIVYYLNNSRLKELIITGGTTQKFMSLGMLRRIKVKYPPLAEQKKIVEYLDSLSTKVSELQKLQSETATDFAALKQSILHKAFSGELLGEDENVEVVTAK